PPETPEEIVLAPILTLAALTSTLPDQGIFPEYTPLVGIAAPSAAPRGRAWLRVDPAHGLVTLYASGDPIKAWPAAVPPRLGARANVAALHLRAGEPGAAPGDDAVLLAAADLVELGRLA